MPVICFEGASAVGKTTTARALKATRGAFVIPEVNELFVRPENEPAEWYLERQVERSTLASDQSRAHPLVILDGDPFQPLWYNWAYHFAERQDLEFLARYYRPKIQDKLVRFPDLYVVFEAGESELVRRKERDATRRRRGFAKHLRMIEPQRRYFRAIGDLAPGRIAFLAAETVEANVEFVGDRGGALTSGGGGEEGDGELFDRAVEWLRRNTA